MTWATDSEITVEKATRKRLEGIGFKRFTFPVGIMREEHFYINTTPKFVVFGLSYDYRDNYLTATLGIPVSIKDVLPRVVTYGISLAKHNGSVVTDLETEIGDIMTELERLWKLPTEQILEMINRGLENRIQSPFFIEVLNTEKDLVEFVSQKGKR